MNFFSDQDQARRHTRWLVVSFVLAVMILIIITNVLVAITYWLVDGQLTHYWAASEVLVQDISGEHTQYFTWVNFGKISLLVCGVISCAVLYKWLQLRGGGRKVAEALGGVRMTPSTKNKEHRQVLNVVEEMALASGMPVPCVYLLKGEKGINAFAAGNMPADAVIGITQGALDQFNREQLQGVIAHEFSHILNGDMRLNLRMMCLLHGIIFIGGVGEFLMRSGGYHGYHPSGAKATDFRVFLLGAALLIIGWLGMFFGGLIKAAISRQREFLADASAVQFTHNPQGIADALKIMGGYSAGSQVFSARSREASHMFIGEALGSLARFDTHPPLVHRIKRIQPDWNGQFERREMKIVQPKRTEPSTAGEMPISALSPSSVEATEGGGELVSGIIIGAQTIEDLPQLLREQAHDPFGACALLFALLLSQDENTQAKQLSYVKQMQIPGLSLQTLDFSPEIIVMDKRCRLPLLELVVPALKNMSAPQYKRFKKVLLLLIRADAKFELFEWCLFQLVRHYLRAEFETAKFNPPVYKNIEAIRQEYCLVLSMLAHSGHVDDAIAMRAFIRGAGDAGLDDAELVEIELCQLDDFVKAVDKISNCYPLLKPRLLKGLVSCAAYDGEITAEEKEILSAVAAVIDCPMPSLLEIINR